MSAEATPEAEEGGKPQGIEAPESGCTREALTRDAVLGGRILLRQPKDGYRFSVDAVLLARFADAQPEGTILDLGCGCGVAALILAYLHPGTRVFGVEIDDSQARLARLNAVENGLAERVRIVRLDWKELPHPALPRFFDLVVVNPPFRKAGSGRRNPAPSKAAARHEMAGSLSDAAAAASLVLHRGGRFAAIYPASRLADAFAAFIQNGIEPKRLRIVHSRPGEPARLVLIEGRKGAGRELAVLPPLFLYGEGRDYSPETAALLG